MRFLLALLIAVGSASAQVGTAAQDAPTAAQDAPQAAQGMPTAPQDGLDEAALRQQLDAVRAELARLEGDDAETQARRGRLDARRQLVERGLAAVALARLHRALLEGKAEPLPLPEASAIPEIPPALDRDPASYEWWEWGTRSQELDDLFRGLKDLRDSWRQLAKTWQGELEDLRRDRNALLARTVKLLEDQRKEADQRLAALRDRLGGQLDPDERQRLELERRVIEAEQATRAVEAERRQPLRDALNARITVREQALEALTGPALLGLLEQRLGTVEGLRAGLEAVLLPSVDPKTLAEVPQERREAVEAVFRRSRERIQALLPAIAEASLQNRELENELTRIQNLSDEAVAERDRQLKLASEEDLAPVVLSFRLKSGQKALQRLLDKPVLPAGWLDIGKRQAALERRIDELAGRIEDLPEQLDGEIAEALGTRLGEAPRALRDEVQTAVVRETAKVENLLSALELCLAKVFRIEQVFRARRVTLQEARRLLRHRGVLLRDPDRLSLRALDPRILLGGAADWAGRIGRLPGEVFARAFEHRMAGTGATGLVGVATLLCLGLLVGSRVLRRRVRHRVGVLQAAEEVGERDFMWTAMLVVLARLLPWVALSSFLTISANVFEPGGTDQRLCERLAAMLFQVGLWYSLARTLFGPGAGSRRLLQLEPGVGRRFHRLAMVGLVLLLCERLADLVALLHPGVQGEAFADSLGVFVEGGMLLIGLLAFGRREALLQLVPVPKAGNWSSLRGCVRLAIWPIRVVLSVALGAWLLAYFDLAKMIGGVTLGLFSAAVLSLLVHHVLRTEIRHRFGDPDAGPAGAEPAEDEDPEVGYRRARLALLGKYLEIVEVLASYLVFLGALSWLWDIPITDLRTSLGFGLWGGGAGGTPVTLFDVVSFAILVYLTTALTRRVRPTIELMLKDREGIDRGLRYTFGTLIGYVVFVVGLWIALQRLHFGLEQVGLLFAALGVGIGFGLQDIVSNFFSGLILLFERPLKVGDVIQVGTTVGEVKRITIRSTTVTSFDNIDIIVPNKDFISTSITNWTARDRDLRSIIEVGVAYGSDLKRVREVLLETFAKHGNVYRKPAPAVYLKDFQDSGILLAVYFWTALDNRLATTSDLRFAIEAAFRREGIAIPFPQRDVWLREGAPLRVRVDSDAEPRASGEDEAAAAERSRELERRLEERRQAAGGEDTGKAP
ncbi:MAG: mechanosensitive ion channel [Planctomycetota bacterium]